MHRVPARRRPRPVPNERRAAAAAVPHYLFTILALIPPGTGAQGRGQGLFRLRRDGRRR